MMFFISSLFSVRMVFISILSLTVITIAGCESTKKTYVSSEEVYIEAKKTFDDKQYFDSIILFEDFITRYPYSKHLADAQLYRSEAFFQSKQYASSASSFYRFRMLHPSHPQHDYSLYMEGLSYWKNAPKAANKELTNLKNALKIWKQLRTAFPDSIHLTEAEPLIKQGKHRLAQNELIVTRFYCKTKKWLNCIFMVDEFLKNHGTNSEYTQLSQQAADMGLTAINKLSNPKIQKSLDFDDHLTTRDIQPGQFESYLGELKAKWRPFNSSPPSASPSSSPSTPSPST